MARLVLVDREAVVTPIATLYNCGQQKSFLEPTGHVFLVPVSCSWLTGVEPNVVYCCCSSVTLMLEVVVCSEILFSSPQS